MTLALYGLLVADSAAFAWLSDADGTLAVEASPVFAAAALTAWSAVQLLERTRA